jgi:hypothetical protein
MMTQGKAPEMPKLIRFTILDESGTVDSFEKLSKSLGIEAI